MKIVKIFSTNSFLLTLAILLLSSNALLAQVSGKVLDEKGDALMGATVLIDGTTLGAKADMDGKFTIKNVPDGTYNLIISYLAYTKKTITGIEVKKGTTEYITVSMEKENKKTKDVVIKGQTKKESINALLIQQKNMATISDGISAEAIKRTPDRNTGDVLKRVSGVTITEGKFAVIRGLADRYNIAMLNGDMLPSSESDRKTFSFDIFPSALLENIVISKAATPDKPGEFSGGIIDLATKDISTEPFLNIQLGTGGNSISTFRPYTDAQNSSTDGLGFDKSFRPLPTSFPDAETYRKSTRAQKYEYSKAYGNRWALERNNSMPLNRSVQLSGGYSKTINKESNIGVIGAVSYNRNFRSHYIPERMDISDRRAYNFNDTVHRDNVLLGTILNFGYKINNNHRIKFKNSFSVNSEDQSISRIGTDSIAEFNVKSNASWFTSNQLLSNQLIGDHVITKRKIKIQWGLANNSIVRNTPDLRKAHYFKNYTDSAYRAYIPLQGSPFYSGSFNATTKENIRSGNLDVSIPFEINKVAQNVKVGAYYQTKTRSYDARVLGYKVANLATYNSSIELLDQEQLFNNDKIGDKGILLDDISQPSDEYDADSKLSAAYLMLDNKVFEKIRLVYGARIEHFEQNLVTGVSKPGDLTVNKKNTNILPSLNATYLLNSKTNLRFSASQTLSRPEFREIAPSAFYNYNLLMIFTGEPNLEQTKIQNYDLRYEYFMGKGEIISASVFYKHFDKPIEFYMRQGQGTRALTYINGTYATNVGMEVEFRKSLSFLSKNPKSPFNHIGVYGNLAYIHSKVESVDTTGTEDLIRSRRLQGQSPYIINVGATYTHPKHNLGISLAYNRIGERIFAIGNGFDFEDLYEAPRNIIDLQLSKKFKNKFEVRFAISDLLANPQIFYYNINKDVITQKDTKQGYQNSDFIFSRQQMGTNFSLSLSYQIK